MSSQGSIVLLNRILGLKDGLPFILIVDSLIQSSYYLLREFMEKSSSEIIYVSFETVNRPKYASHFIDATTKSYDQIIENVKQSISVRENTNALTKKTLIIVDSLNFIDPEILTNFVSQLISASTILLGVYHNDMTKPVESNPNYPSPLTLLNYISSSVFEIEPYFKSEVDQEEFDNDINKLKIPIYNELNSHVYKLELTSRRKSGRSLTHKFIIDSLTHTYEIFKEPETSSGYVEDESLLKDLTTFNLTTSLKNKLAKEQVELPYMEAQNELGSVSGAIVYEFEKDDDYDEEDPYEDPF